MRASPPIDLSLNRFEAWRVAVATLALVTAATTVAWLVTTTGQRSTVLTSIVGLATVVALGLALAGARTAPARLRWDGACWHLASGGDPVGSEPAQGRLEVVIDLGAWLLLRFHPGASATRSGRRCWLPVQRRGLEAQWHALRCAVHAPWHEADPR